MRYYLYLVLLLSCLAEGIKAQNSDWLVVMREGTHAQNIKISATFPKSFIESKKASGEQITELAYQGEQWLVVTSPNRYSDQVYSLTENFPGEWIKERWKVQFDLTHILYTNEGWLVVMSKGQGYQGESWALRSQQKEVDRYISQAREKGKSITNICYGMGKWVVTTAVNNEISDQQYVWTALFPKEWIEQQREANYSLAEVAYGKGMWMVVMNKNKKILPETYIVEQGFPKQFIQSESVNKKRIALVYFNFSKDDNQSFNDYLNLAKTAIEEEAYDRAILYYSKALELNPKSAKCYNNRAWAKFLKSECHSALADIYQSIRLEESPYNYHTKGAILHCLNRHREALIAYDKSIAILNVEKGFYFADRAEVKKALGNYEDAIADYEYALRIDPNNQARYQEVLQELNVLAGATVEPMITWDYPYNDFYTTEESMVNIRACINSREAITEVFYHINGKAFKGRGLGVEQDCSENINASLTLSQGINTIKLEIRTASHQVMSTERKIEVRRASKGNYHALLIGVGEYEDYAITDLKSPVQDIRQLESVLEQNYTFEPGNIHTLTNPTKAKILEKLIYLEQRLGEDDNLLIFYSGHGVVKNNMGYWLPANAAKSSRVQWFSNAELQGHVSNMNNKHTLIVADACFSGAILTGGFRDMNTYVCEELEKMTSRRAMTSGANTLVPDKSTFFKYLIKYLKDSEESCFSAEMLYNKIKPSVIFNSVNSHIPQFGVLPNMGDEGGNFIFKKR